MGKMARETPSMLCVKSKKGSGQIRQDLWLLRMGLRSCRAALLGTAVLLFSGCSDGSGLFTPNLRISDYTPVTAVASTFSSGAHGIAVANETIYVVWADTRNGSGDQWFEREIFKGDIYFTKSVDGDNTFSPNVQVNDDTGTAAQCCASLAVGADGRIYVVWRDARNGHSDIYFARSDDGGATFSPNVQVNDDTGTDNQEHPSIALAPNGTIYIAWQDRRNLDTEGAHIYLAKSTDGGLSFGPNVKVSDHLGAVSDGPSLAVDPNGIIYIAWHDNRNSTQTVIQSDIYVSKSAGGGITFTPAVKASGDNALGSNRYPSLTLDSNGHLYLVWHIGHNGIWDIYFSKSTDGGVTFSPYVRVNDTTGIGDSLDPSIAVDHQGIISVVWRDNRVDGAPHILFSQSRDGVRFSPHMRVDDAAWGAYFPSLAVDSGGKAYIIWSDARSLNEFECCIWLFYTPTDVYFARSR
jgi:hypothetical protein